MMRWMKKVEIEEVKSDTDTDRSVFWESQPSETQYISDLSLKVGQTEIV